MEKINKLKGHFSYVLKDLNGNVIQEYSENNKIMNHVMDDYFQTVTQGVDSSSNGIKSTNISDFYLVTFAIGDKGIDSDGQIQPIIGTETELNAEKDPDGFVYQVSWAKLSQNTVVTKTSEGSKGSYDGPVKSPTTEEGLTVYSEIKDNKVFLNIEMEKYTGNGQEFSEAALYLKKGKDLPNNKLGRMFSMKRFNKVTKTDQCILSMKWIIDFGL